MKKKILLTLVMIAVLVCAMLCVASARDAYLEEIPEHLLFSDDTVTHFIVFDDEKYYTGSGSTLDGLNVENIESALESLNITSDMIGGGKTYLTKFVFPAYLNGTLLTYINVNTTIKTNKYFSNVCGYVSFPGTMTKTHDMNQCVEQLRGIDFGANSQLEIIPTCFANRATRLKEVKNFPTAKLTKIESDAFNSAKYAFSGELIINAQSVGEGAFNNATTYVTSLVFGENLTKLGTQSFSVRSGETGLGSPLLEYIEFKSNVAEIESASYGPFYFELGSNSRSEYTSLKCIIISHEDNKMAIANGATTFNDIAPSSYIRFLLNEANEFIYPSHEIGYENATISYESFLENGTLTGYCTRCNKAETVSAPAIFECLGYSAPMNGNGGIAIGFTVNNEAMAQYKAISGNEIAYGAFAVSQQRLGENNIFDENGSAVKGAIVADLTSYGFSNFEIKIVGFADNQKDIMLALGGYVCVTEDDKTTYSYMQYGTPAQGQNYRFDSYNTVLEILNTAQ